MVSTCVWFSTRNFKFRFYPDINSIRIIFLLNLTDPAFEQRPMNKTNMIMLLTHITLEHILDRIIVVVVDVHPGLDAESRVPHPVVVVAAPGSVTVRGRHHRAALLHVQVRAVVLLHSGEELIREAGAVSDPVIVVAVAVTAAPTVRVETPGSVPLYKHTSQYLYQGGNQHGGVGHRAAMKCIIVKSFEFLAGNWWSELYKQCTLLCQFRKETRESGFIYLSFPVRSYVT